MKFFPFFSLLMLAVPVVAQENPTAPPAGKADFSPNQKAFLNLPEEKRKEFVKQVDEANRLFQQKRVFEAMDGLGKADKIFDQSPEVMNLRGACYVEMRSFDKALAEFQRAKKLSPENASVDFNIAEVYFVTKEWKKAADLYTQILNRFPTTNLDLGRLMEFKLLLCKNKLGLKEEVIVLSEKYDYQDDSPYYYYAQAALAYNAGNTAKAEEWLATASRIFRNPNVIAPWQDTLVEYGYIKGFYGDDIAK